MKIFRLYVLACSNKKLENPAEFCYFLFMTNEEIIRKFSALPLEARREAADFIAFLDERYGRKDEKPADENINDENFIGIWKDREDLSDGAAWVRELRRDEWAK